MLSGDHSCPGRKRRECCEPSPFYFAWGCFSDFVSGPCGVPPKGLCAADLILCRRLGRELREHRGDDRSVGAPGMAAADEEGALAGVLLVLQRVAALRLLAVGHGLVERGH